METNGYQPLWLLILSFAAAIVGGDRVLLIAATHLIALCAILSFVILSRREYGTIWPAAAVMLLFPNIMTAGMETVLIPPLALLYFRSETAHRRGVFASLLFLARLDTLALVIGRTLYDVVMQRRLNLPGHALLLSTITCYMGLNVALFGTPVPVSGLAKAVGNVAGENLPTSLRLLRRALPTLIALAPLAILRWRGAYTFRNPHAIIAALCAIALCALYYGVFSGWPLWSWYLWPVVLAAYFCLVEFAGIEARLRPSYILAGRLWRIIALTLMATHFLAAFWVYHGRFRQSSAPADRHSAEIATYGQANVLSARDWNRHDIKMAKFAMGDRAGSLGYFLDDRFELIQLEGLVGSYDQILEMRADRSKAFINRAHVDWLIVDRDEALQEIAGQFVIEEPFQGLSVHKGSFVLCFPLNAETRGAWLSLIREHRYLFRYADQQECSPAAMAWFANWRSRYHGPIRGDLGQLPLFMNYPGDY